MLVYLFNILDFTIIHLSKGSVSLKAHQSIESLVGEGVRQCGANVGLAIENVGTGGLDMDI